MKSGVEIKITIPMATIRSENIPRTMPVMANPRPVNSGWLFNCDNETAPSTMATGPRIWQHKTPIMPNTIAHTAIWLLPAGGGSGVMATARVGGEGGDLGN